MINFEEARDLLRRAVETQGRDFIYNPEGLNDCYYEPIDANPEYPDDPRTKTGCLIGVALDLAGETRHRSSISNILNIYRQYPDMMTDDAARYFLDAQSMQDKGHSWGETFDMAERNALSFIVNKKRPFTGVN